ncbi:MAG TPA: M20 family peptidase [Longimicrobiales bacterium]|nr:M20 family peptidase [Longimicrobiales bacterium]
MSTLMKSRLQNIIIAAAAVGILACGSAQSKTEPGSIVAPEVRVSSGAAERLAGSIRFATISHADSAAFDGSAFQALHAYLQREFPRVHSELEREVVAGYSLLFKWQGSDPALEPILLMGHMDVVPVEPGTENKWEKEPFSGTIADGFIWGRGSIDNKSTVVGTLEAVEMLLAEGFRPRRTVYLAFGHDEEVGGARGARAVAELLRQRGVELELVLDEGGVIGDGIMKGVTVPTALVGIAEKGFASVELNTRANGGHSSLPPRESAIGILSAAITRLEENQLPARLEEPTRKLFDRISPEFPRLQRAMFASLWLTKPLILNKLQENPTTNAMVRTTTAVTIFQAGTKENVLASRARAVVNFRILPGDSIVGVLNHVRETISDPRVQVRLADGFTAEPSAITRTDTDVFRTVERTIRSLAPSTIVAPYLVVVVTDARYYAPISKNVLRFLPLRMQPSDLPRIHGTNERIAVRDYEWAIRFYRQLIANAAA